MKLRSLMALAPMALLACSGGTGDPNGPGGMNPMAPAKANVSVTQLDFGGVDCGGQDSDAKSVTIKNEGGSPLTWSASLTQADAFTLAGPTSGTIAAGESVSLGVVAKAVPASSKAGSMAQATLNVMTSDTALPATAIALSRMAQGASFEVMPSMADFGELPVHTQAPDVKLTIRNTGNKAVEVSLAGGGDFDASWKGAPSTTMLAPETELDGAVARFKPSSNKMQTGKIQIHAKGAVCGEIADIPVKGVGTNGVAGVSPGTVNYGLVDCGTQAVAQQISILNSGNAAFDFKATLGKGNDSPYQLSAATGTVLAGNQVQIMVTPKGIPQTSATTQNLYGDSLVITTTAQDDQAHKVDLQETAHGAILSFGAGSVQFGQQKVGSNPSQQLKIQNDGNLTANVTIAPAAPFSVPSSAQITGGSNSTINIGFTPDPKNLGQPISSQLAISTNATLCGALPTAAPITGTSYDRVAQVGAGDGSTCVLATSGIVYCWGDNTYGQLGDGTNTFRSRPYPVQGLSGTITQLASAGVSSCALTNKNTVQCWGANYYGQLGNNTITDSTSPVAVQNLVDATKLASGRSWVCAVRQGGSVACWGSNYDGQLGNGNTNYSMVPVAVSNLNDALSLGGGYSHVCAVRTGGNVSCWGSNYYGELGNGTLTSSSVPVAVTSLSNASSSAFGIGNHSCTVQKNGTVACWGDNFYGQLGNGTTTGASTYVTVSNINDATALALGSSHSCALRSGGSVVCWGDNASGELGNGTTSMSTVPVSVANMTNVSTLSGGNAHTCAVRSTGTLACWGYNGYGQLGNGTVNSASLPVDVVGLN